MAIRVVVIGAGHLGTFYLEKLAACQEAQLVGVVEPHAERRLQAMQRYHIAGSSCVATFLEQADAAIVVTPTQSHTDIACQALQRGWHVLLEKPMAASVSQAEAILQAATVAGKVLQIGHSERFNPAVAAALEISQCPKYVVAERLAPFSGRGADTDVVLDLMIHDLDIVGSLITAPVQEIRSLGVCVLTQSVDMAAARIAFADGSVAQLSAGRASLTQVRKLRFFTPQRYVSVDCLRREVTSVKRQPVDDATNADSAQAAYCVTGEPIDVAQGDPLALQIADFLNCIRFANKPRVDGYAGLKALQLAHAVKDAMQV